MTVERRIIEQVIMNVLRLGLDDFVQIGWVYSDLVHYRPDLDPSERWKVALEIIRIMLERGLVEVGDLENGFRRWEMDNQQILDEIERGLKESPPGEEWLVCWFKNTEKGDQVARQQSDRDVS